MKKLYIFLFFSILIYGKNVVLWHSWQDNNKELLELFIEEYNELMVEKGENTIIKSYYYPFDQLLEKYTETTSAFTGPDILIGKHDWIPSLSLKKKIEPLDNYYTNKYFSTFLKNTLNLGKYKNNVYGIPLKVDNIFVVYNPKYFEEEPKNIDDYRKIMEQLPTGISPLSYQVTNSYFHIPLLTSFNGSYLGKQNELLFTSDEFLDSLYALRDYLQEGLIKNISSEELLINSFKNGTSAAIITGPWALDKLKDSKFKIALLPQFNSEYKTLSPLNADILMVSENSPYKRASVEFIEFLTTYNNQIRLIDIGLTPTVKVDTSYIKIREDEEKLRKILEQYSYSYLLPHSPEMTWAVWDYANLLLDKVVKGEESITREVYRAEAEAKEIILLEKNNFSE